MLIDTHLLQKYDKPGPRYTSYPTVPVWSTAFSETDWRRALGELARRPATELSIYLHLPFCAKRCHYCGCNAVAGGGAQAVDRYLDCLARELEMIGRELGDGHRAVQIHWGGGTPNFLDTGQTARALDLILGMVPAAPQAELSLEADPRLGSPDQATKLREAGFNRISLGVQDFDRRVQEAIGRRQSEKRTREFFAACRRADFGSVNLDLVYGLPAQTEESFTRTLELTIELAPDRVACFGYAHVPWVRSNQKQIDEDLLPSPERKFALFQQAVAALSAAGYVWIGMDHFARADDALALAYRERRLHRNFMGYTTRPAVDLLAVGMSGISELAGCFAQNDSDLATYQSAVTAGRLPIARGHRLSRDDEIRRLLITHLMCNLELPYDLTEATYGFRVDDEFALEIDRMEPLADDGLVLVDRNGLKVTELGRFFIRNICMEWDAHLDRQATRPVFSRTV